MNNLEKNFSKTNEELGAITQESSHVEYSKETKDMEDLFEGVEPTEKKETQETTASLGFRDTKEERLKHIEGALKEIEKNLKETEKELTDENILENQRLFCLREELRKEKATLTGEK